eukprot:2227519-Amphidinium_carterae.1
MPSLVRSLRRGSRHGCCKSGSRRGGNSEQGAAHQSVMETPPLLPGGTEGAGHLGHGTRS